MELHDVKQLARHVVGFMYRAAPSIANIVGLCIAIETMFKGAVRLLACLTCRY